jgi:hypothetical protein
LLVEVVVEDMHLVVVVVLVDIEQVLHYQLHQDLL